MFRHRSFLEVVVEVFRHRSFLEEVEVEEVEPFPPQVVEVEVEEVPLRLLGQMEEEFVRSFCAPN